MGNGPGIIKLFLKVCIIYKKYVTTLKSGFYSTKVVSAEESVNIEKSTIDQADNQLWIVEWWKRITASNAGNIAKMRATTKQSSKVKQLLYSSFKGSAATGHVIEREPVTRQKCITHMQGRGCPYLTIRAC